MSNTITYRPFRSSSWGIPVALGLAILALVMLGYYLPYIDFGTFTNMDFGALIFFVMSIGSMWCLKTFCNSSNIVIFFEDGGLRIAGGRHNNYCYVLWENITYAYYERNFKGFLFLVLSPTALDKKQVKQFVNRCANSAKLHADPVVTIPIDETQDVSLIKELIKHHVPYVTTC